MHYAIERKDPDLLEFVLDLIPGNPAEFLNTPTYDENCSLHIAVGLQMADIEQHKKIVRLLMRRGADASHRNNSRHLPRELVANRNQEVGWHRFNTSTILTVKMEGAGFSAQNWPRSNL